MFNATIIEIFRLANDFKDVCELLFSIYFLSCLVTIASQLVIFQVELVRCA